MPDYSQTLVITGDDNAFNIDLSAFRGVREVTGMRFTRLKNPSRAVLQNHLRRLRRELSGRLPNIHIAAHMGPEGVHLKEGVIDAEELSELLAGAGFVFLAGCESADIGDALASVPATLTLLEKISNQDAVAASLVWWTEIARGQDIQYAFDAIAEVYPAVAEHAFLHTNPFLLSRMRPQ